MLQGRGFIDVTWTVDLAGYTLDVASVTDGAPEFDLSGLGLGTIKLDSGQAPVRLDTSDDTSYSFRYWTTGAFAASAGSDDTVAIDLIAGSWSLTANTQPNPSAATASLTDAQWLRVNFDNVPAGFAIDPASITDLDAEFTLSYAGQNLAKNGAGSIALVSDVAPQRIGNDNTYRFRVTGDFAADGTQSVTLNYIAKSWSFTGETAPATVSLAAVDASVLAAASKSYIDIAFAPSVKLSGGGAYTITAIPTNTEIELSGNGITGPPNTVINPLDMGAIDATSLANNITFDATALANNVYRYYVDASKFQVSGTGVVTILVKAGAVVDSATSGNSNRATTQSFTVQGTTVHVAGPADGGLIGMASLNNRGFLDVTFGFPSGKTPDLDSIYDIRTVDSLGVEDLGAEFTIDSSTGHSITLDATQAPVRLGETGYTFRYFTLGKYTSGPVTLKLIPGAIAFTDGSKSTSADDMAVEVPATANVGYIDIRYQPVAGMVLDADSIRDPEAEFC
ncbi:MAG: hypothetical protein IPK39_05840 [Sulfuritalea sp.]|nr:hypothetical protein [Sulfuritalea sp.]